MRISFNKLLVLLISFAITSCTLPPKPVGDEAQTQAVNTKLVCAKQIDIIQMSINGAKPPKAAFELSMKKLRKYTTDNITIHKLIELDISEKDINPFIHNFAHHADSAYLTPKQGKIIEQKFKGSLRKSTTIVMIYTPKLNREESADSNSQRGLAFTTNTYQPINVVAYNETNINNSPVISNTQAWKIVLTHELGHRLGVPSSASHNKDWHCTRRECVLYSSPDVQSILSVPLNGMPYDFCRLCKVELSEAKKSCSARR